MVQAEQPRRGTEDDAEEGRESPRYRCHFVSRRFVRRVVDERVEADAGDVNPQRARVQQELQEELVVRVSLRGEKANIREESSRSAERGRKG